MFSLIFKDIIIQKKTVSYMLLYIVVVIVFMDGLSSDALYVLITVTIAFAVSSGAFAIDEKYRSEMVMASLPITRSELVQSRYLSVFVYAAASILVMTLVGIMINICNIHFIKLNYITLLDVKRILAACVLITSINYPMYFKYGYNKAKIANFLIYFMFFTAVITISENSSEGKIDSYLSFMSNLSNGSFQIIGGLALVLIFTVSYFISINCYEKKEL